MSLILEALRKSEAERRRAQVPDLLSQPQAVEAVARAPAARWPVWIGIAVLALIAAWFVLHRAPAKVEDEGADAATQAPAIAAPAPIASNPAPAARPAPALQRPLVVAPRVAAPAPASPATHVAAIATDIPASLPPPPAAPAPTPISHDTTERITDLGPDERKALPPLKLSMHMWNDVTAQRFVIIDGTRLVVGDHIGPLVVSDIVPDGVLLDWNGRALKLPLR